MDRGAQWTIWVVTLVLVNMPTSLLASFTLIATTEDTSVFSIDYLAPIVIVALSNIVVVMVLVTIFNDNYKGFIIGLVLSVAQSISMYFLIDTFSQVWFIAIGVILLITVCLLIREVKWTKKSKLL